MSKQKIALITGLNGFIGKHLSDLLYSKGFQVAGFPRESLFDVEAVTKVVKEVNPDYIFHLAAYGNHSDQKDVTQVFISNVLSTYFLLSANAEQKAKFINISSSSVYGEKSKAMKETHYLETDSMYGATKVSAEYLSTAMGKAHGFDVVNIRPFSVYGGGEKETRFIPTIINSILESKTLTLEPNATHDWIYVEDFVRGVVFLMDEVGQQTFNLGTGIEHTNKEVVEMVEKLMNSTVKEIKEMEGLREQTPKVWKSDMNKVFNKGFKPEYTLYDGLVKTISYYVVDFVGENAKE